MSDVERFNSRDSRHAQADHLQKEKARETERVDRMRNRELELKRLKDERDAKRKAANAKSTTPTTNLSHPNSNTDNNKRKDMKRPKRITFIGCLLILASAIGFLSVLYTLVFSPTQSLPIGPVPHNGMLIFTLLSHAIVIICAFYFLKGVNRGRLLYTGINLLTLSITIVNIYSTDLRIYIIQMPYLLDFFDINSLRNTMYIAATIPSMIFLAILYSPKANEYFSLENGVGV